MKIAKHARVPVNLDGAGLPGARLLAFEQVMRGRRMDLLVSYQALYPTAPVEMFESGGLVYEHVQGVYLPRRLCFSRVSGIRCEGKFSRLAALPLEHSARTIRGVFSWIPPNARGVLSVFAHEMEGPDRLWVTSQEIQSEETQGIVEPADLVCNWSPPPPFKPGLIPLRTACCKRYGGDPVTIRLGERQLHYRLFVGGVDCQEAQRPLVDAVLNIGEEPSGWVKDGQIHPSDRWVTSGEGELGMNAAELLEKANWVVERLRQGQRVLVHCAAGLNRSVTICCAVLILEEGLTAEAALARVREQHGWARPDEHHWLVLKWLAKKYERLPACKFL